ncbi:hypothetical protein [Novipirellula maiorica]|nr:hypothetical protein [Rhodopirellula maiorica]
MPLLNALDRARDMLAATAVWQEIADASHIYYDALPPASPGPDYTRTQIENLRPLAILWHEVNGGFRLAVATADACTPIASGRMVIQIELNVPAEHADNPTAVGRWVMDLIGRLIRSYDTNSPGLWELSNRPGYLPLVSIDVDAYIRTSKKEVIALGDAVVFDLTLTWGHQ